MMDLKIGFKSMEIQPSKSFNMENLNNRSKEFDQVFKNKIDDQNKSSKEVNKESKKDTVKTEKKKIVEKDKVSDEGLGDEVEKIEDKLELFMENLRALIHMIKDDSLDLGELNLEELGLGSLNLETLELENMKLGELLSNLEELISENYSFTSHEFIDTYESMENLSQSLETELTKMMKTLKEEPEKVSDEMARKLDSLKDQKDQLVELTNQGQKITDDLLNLENSKDELLVEENTSKDLDVKPGKDLASEEIESRKDSGELKAEDNQLNQLEDIEVEESESSFYTLESTDRRTSEDISQVMDKELPQVEEKEIIEQIVSKAKVIVEDGKQEIRIKLKPEVLGDLVLKMEVVKDTVLAKIMVDNHRTKELIEANLIHLQEEMKDNNLEIKTFEVFVGSNHDFEQEEREQEFIFNNKNKRVKLKKDEVAEVQVYDDNVVSRSSGTYEDGKLNLFA